MPGEPPPDYATDELPVAAVRARIDSLPAPGFLPREPRKWEETGVDVGLAEQIVLRSLIRDGAASGREIATDLCVAQPLCKELLEALKVQKLVQHRGTTDLGDFFWEVTDAGRNKALEYRKVNAYVGPLPVPYDQWLKSVAEQTIANVRPDREQIARAFADLVLPRGMIEALGPAVTSGRAIFLHGDPGNGKTSIAERITRAYGDTIYIPVTLLVDGHLVKFYDPATHEHVPVAQKTLSLADRLDRRWVRVRRPTLVAGGELTLDMLEIQRDPSTGVCEAPLQVKANGGTLVIDDFGRQRIDATTLLNRWIFPLERRKDYLRVPDGRKISVPFDALLVFSTNLEPRDLVDEAFLRRIPYKIRVSDPTADEFRILVETVADANHLRLPSGSVAYLLKRHYAERPMRFCHARDLVTHVVDACRYERRALVADPRDWDHAVAAYFGAS